MVRGGPWCPGVAVTNWLMTRNQPKANLFVGVPRHPPPTAGQLVGHQSWDTHSLRHPPPTAATMNSGTGEFHGGGCHESGRLWPSVSQVV